MPIPFNEYFHGDAPRTITLDEGNEYTLPPGTYTFEDEYCSSPYCDCQRAQFNIKADWTPKRLAYIDYGWESANHYKQWLEDEGWSDDDDEDWDIEKETSEMAGASLEYHLCSQNRYSESLLSLFKNSLLSDAGFLDQIKQRYQVVREAVDDAAKQRKRIGPLVPSSKLKPLSGKKKAVYPDPIVLPDGFRVEALVSPEIVRQALLSPVEAVRIAAATYFDRSDVANEVPDCGVMRTVIDSIMKYGREKSLGILEDRKFPQNEATVRWMVDELDKEYDLNDIPTDNYCFRLAELLCQADPALLSEDMVERRCFPSAKAHEFLVRLEFAKEAKEDWHELWHRAIDGDDYDIDDAEVWEALARQPEHKDTVLRALKGNAPTIQSYRHEDLLPSLIDLVADMHLTEALPWIVREIRDVERSGYTSYFQDNMMELSNALGRLADKETLDMFKSRWLERPHKHQWFLDVLVELKTPWAMNACLETLCRRRLDKSTRLFMVQNLMENFVSEALPLVLPFEPEFATDPMLRQQMVVAHLVNPVESFDLFEQWLAGSEKRRWNLVADHERHRYERLRDDRDPYDELDEEDDDYEENDDDHDDSYYYRRGDDCEESDYEEDDDEFDNEFDEPLENKADAIEVNEEYEVDDTKFGDDDVVNSDDAELLSDTIRNSVPRVGRNDPCPCGSGKKYKKCCME